MMFFCLIRLAKHEHSRLGFRPAALAGSSTHLAAGCSGGRRFPRATPAPTAPVPTLGTGRRTEQEGFSFSLQLLRFWRQRFGSSESAPAPPAHRAGERCPSGAQGGADALSSVHSIHKESKTHSHKESKSQEPSSHVELLGSPGQQNNRAMEKPEEPYLQEKSIHPKIWEKTRSR